MTICKHDMIYIIRGVISNHLEQSTLSDLAKYSVTLGIILSYLILLCGLSATAELLVIS